MNNNTSSNYKMCISCSGNGSIKCDCNYDKTSDSSCSICGGEGEFICSVCDGRGSF